MMAKLRIIEGKADQNVRLPDNIIPMKLESIMEPLPDCNCTLRQVPSELFRKRLLKIT